MEGSVVLGRDGKVVAQGVDQDDHSLVERLRVPTAALDGPLPRPVGYYLHAAIRWRHGTAGLLVQDEPREQEATDEQGYTGHVDTEHPEPEGDGPPPPGLVAVLSLLGQGFHLAFLQGHLGPLLFHVFLVATVLGHLLGPLRRGELGGNSLVLGWRGRRRGGGRFRFRFRIRRSHRGQRGGGRGATEGEGFRETD